MGSFILFDSINYDLQAHPALVVHAGETWYDSIARGKIDFFHKVASALSLPAVLVRSELGIASKQDLMEKHVNLVIGPRTPIGKRIWHCHPGYMRGYWYLDPLGVNMRSSIASAHFDRGSVDPAYARKFWKTAIRRNLERNLSKYPQEPRVIGGLPRARTTVFLQEIERYSQPVHWIDSVTMIRVAACAGPTYVKLHPHQSNRMIDEVSKLATQLPQISVSSASVHDLVAAADVIVTQNSAAGFEALLQKKPVITCALSDYRHATIQVRSADDLSKAIESAPEKLARFPFERYVCWFLEHMLIEPSNPNFPTRIRQLIKIDGIDWPPG